MKKYYFLYYFLLFLVLGLSLFFWINKDKFLSKFPSKAEETKVGTKKNLLDLSTKLYNNLKSLSNNLDNEKEFSKRFCEIVLKKDIINKTYLVSKGTIKLKISPSCSVWLYQFCKPFKTENLDNLKVKDFSKDVNINNIFWDEVDRASAIFNNLVNDYFNLKLATLFSDINWQDIETSVKIFSDKYFGSWQDLWCEWGFYLDNEFRFPDSILDKKSICGHPLTYRYLVNFLKEYNLVGFNLALIKNNYKEIDCKIIQNAFSKVELNNTNDMLNFYNLLINEYFWYSLYLNVYKYVLNAKALWISFNSEQIYYNTDFSTVSSDYVDKIKKIDTYLILTRKSINYSIRIINNIYWTFPLHVALLSYFEDLVYFRKYFVTIFTPFHQLYYKLRNVEDLDR